MAVFCDAETDGRGQATAQSVPVKAVGRARFQKSSGRSTLVWERLASVMTQKRVPSLAR